MRGLVFAPTVAAAYTDDGKAEGQDQYRPAHHHDVQP